LSFLPNTPIGLNKLETPVNLRIEKIEEDYNEGGSYFYPGNYLFWDSVYGASSYIVRIYKDGEYLDYMEVNSTHVGLLHLGYPWGSNPGECTATVTARYGNNGDFDSDESSPIVIQVT